MSDAPSKLDALGDLLGVEDETRDLERPTERRPAVGEILRGRATAEPEGERTEARRAQTVPPPIEPTANVATTSRSPRRRAGTSRDTGTTERPTRPLPGRQRTSANLPVNLVERLVAAKQRRWELSDLVVSALDHVELDPARAEDILVDTWNRTRVQRAYQLTPDDIARIDALGERWRMNRSQVLTVILPAELERLRL